MTTRPLVIVALALALVSLAPDSMATKLPSNDNMTDSLPGSVRMPAGYRLAPNQVLSSRYAETNCFNLRKVGVKASVGVICISRSKALLTDMGIDEVSSVSAEVTSSAPHESTGFTVSTPMRQYDMTPLSVTHGRAATAEVDCDLKQGTVYRATGTCRVTVIERDASDYVYFNFRMTDHVRKRPIMSTSQAESILQQFGAP